LEVRSGTGLRGVLDLGQGWLPLKGGEIPTRYEGSGNGSDRRETLPLRSGRPWIRQGHQAEQRDTDTAGPVLEGHEEELEGLYHRGLSRVNLRGKVWIVERTLDRRVLKKYRNCSQTKDILMHSMDRGKGGETT